MAATMSAPSSTISYDLQLGMAFKNSSPATRQRQIFAVRYYLSFEDIIRLTSISRSAYEKTSTTSNMP